MMTNNNNNNQINQTSHNNARVWQSNRTKNHSAHLGPARFDQLAQDLAALKQRVADYQVREVFADLTLADELAAERSREHFFAVLPRSGALRPVNLKAPTSRHAPLPTRNRYSCLALPDREVEYREPVSRRPNIFCLGPAPATKQEVRSYWRRSRVLPKEFTPELLGGPRHKNEEWRQGPDGHTFLANKKYQKWEPRGMHNFTDGLNPEAALEVVLAKWKHTDEYTCPPYSVYSAPDLYRKRDAEAFPTPLCYDDILAQSEGDELLCRLSTFCRDRAREAGAAARWARYTNYGDAEAARVHFVSAKRSYYKYATQNRVCRRNRCLVPVNCRTCHSCSAHCTHTITNTPKRRTKHRRPYGPRSYARFTHTWTRRMLTRLLNLSRPNNAQVGDVKVEIPRDFNITSQHILQIPAVEQLVQWLRTENQSISWTVVIKELIFMIAHLKNGGFTLSNVCTAVAHFLSNVSLPTNFGADIVAWATALLEKYWPRAQSAELLAFIPILGSLITAILCAITMGKLPGGRDTDQLIQRAASIGRLITSFESIQKHVQPWFESLADYIRKSLYGYTSADLNGWKKIDEWCDEVEKLRTPNFEVQTRSDKTLLETVSTLLQRGGIIQRDLDAIRVPLTSRTRITTCMMFLQQARTIASGSGAGLVKPRVAPVTLHFYGDSGVGKSTMLGYLCADLLIDAGCTEPSDMQDKIYYRRPTDTNWDGFRNGTIGVICDDAFSVKDTPSAPNPGVSEQIHMANTAHFPLPMAALPDKGTTIFDARFVIWTTNRHHFTFESLTNPEAVYNRVALKYRMRVKPEYTIVKKVDRSDVTSVNWRKLAEEKKTNPDIDREVMLFDRVHPTSCTEEFEARDLTFDQMRDEVLAEIAVKQQAGREMVEGFTDYFNKRKNAQGALDTLLAARDWFSYNFFGPVYDLPKQTVPHLANGSQRDLHPEAVLRVSPGLPVYFERPTHRRRIYDMVTFGIDTDAKSFAHLNLWASLANYIGVRDPDPTRVLEVENGINYENLFNAHCVIIPEQFVDQWLRQVSLFMRKCADCADPATRRLWFAEYVTLPYQLCFEDAPHHHGADCAGCTLQYSRLHEDKEARLGFQHAFRRDVIEVPLVTRFSNMINTQFERLVLFFGAWAVMWLVQQLAVWLFGKSQDCADGIERKRWSKATHTLKLRQAKILGLLTPDGKPDPRLFPAAEAYQQRAAAAAHRNIETTTINMSEVVTEAYALKDQAALKKNIEAAHEKLKSKNSEATNDQNGTEVNTAVSKNAYMVMSRDGEGEPWYFHGTATALTGRIFITNNHIWYACRHEIALATQNGRHSYKFPKDAVVSTAYSEEDQVATDFILFEAPRNVPLHRSILHHIQKPDAFPYHTTVARVCVSGYGRDGVLKHQYSNDAVACDREFRLTSMTGTTYVRDTYRYAVCTAPGDCGSLVVAHDANITGKIIGMHMAAGDAGSRYTGVATVLRFPVIFDLLTRTAWNFPESWQPSEVPVDNPSTPNVNAHTGVVDFPSPLPGGFTYEGTTNTRIHAATATKIKPSPAHGLVQAPTTKPAMLRPGVCPDGVYRDPRKIAMAKACTPSVYVNEEFLAIASNDVRQMLSYDVLSRDKQILTFEECFAGVEGDGVYAPMNRQASPGWGWPKGLGVGKNPWLTKGDGEWRFDHPELLRQFDEKETLLKNGQRPGFYWIDTLKDERRNIAKVDEGKTRLFSAGEMVATALLRKYFMGFCAHVTRHPIQFESCVGLNVYSRQWDMLARSLEQHGVPVIAGDFTNYDGSLAAPILWEVCDIINDYYQDEYSEIRRLLWLEIVNSIHVHGSDVYTWTHSQPSGCAFTTILNSVYHSVAVRMTYLECAEKYSPLHRTMQAYHQYCTHVNYGDDDVTNVSMDIVEWFNQHTMTEMYTKIGMVYTDETKRADAPAYRTLAEVKFLKRGFHFDKVQRRWRAPLAEETILEMTNWVHGPDGLLLLSMELTQAVYEAAQHPRAKYNELVQKFKPVQALLAATHPVHFPTYDEAQFIDLQRYCGTSELTPADFQLRDRGIGALTDSVYAANPAGVAHGRKTAAESGGELFSSSDECVPPHITTQRLLVRSNASGLKFDPNVQTGLASTTTAMMMSSDPTGSQSGSGPSFAGASEMVHTQQLTTFVEDGDVTTGPIHSQRAPPGFESPARDLLPNEITDVLSRPVQLGTFDWTTLQSPMTELARFPFPNVFFNTLMYAQKLNGFRYARFDVELEIQVNNQPFNAGMFIAYFEPLARQIQYKPSSLATLQGISGYPKVYFRCGSETAVRFTIPFQPVLSHFDTVAKFGTMGDLVIKVVSPLTGSADADATIWMWASNISFEMPTGFPTLLPGPTNAQAGEEPWVGPEGEAVMSDLPDTTPVKKEEKKTPGPVTSILKGLSLASSAVGAISLVTFPALTPFASAGTAIFAAGAAVAKIFGWSKPTDHNTPQLVQQTVGRHMANCAGDAKPKSFALDPENSTNLPLDVFGSAEDTMVISNLIRRYTIADVFSWTKDKNNGALLWKWPVCPSACLKSGITTIDDEVYSASCNSYMSYLSNLARYWRGAIKYKFHFVKTPFHSGRMTIYWIPGATMLTDLSIVDRNMLYKRVVDLRTSTELEFVVPYTHNAHWRIQHAAPQTPFDLQQITNDTPTGIVLVEVTNALRAPSTAADHFDTVVEVAAGDDFQFAYPELKLKTHVALGTAGVSPPSQTMNAQAGDLIYPSPIDTSLKPNSATIGEVFGSLRQLLKRYTRLQDTLFPYQEIPTFPLVTSVGPTVAESVSVPQVSNLWVAMLYRYRSGSIKVLNFMEGLPGGLATHRIAPAVSATADGDLSLAPIIINSNTVEPAYELSIPFYQLWPALPTDVGQPRQATDTLIPVLGEYALVPFNEGTRLYSEYSPAVTSTTAFRSIGEDFSYGFPLGPPATFSSVAAP